MDFTTSIAEKYHLAYTMVKTECKLIRSIVSSHGFREVGSIEVKPRCVVLLFSYSFLTIEINALVLLLAIAFF